MFPTESAVDPLPLEERIQDEVQEVFLPPERPLRTTPATSTLPRSPVREAPLEERETPSLTRSRIVPSASVSPSLQPSGSAAVPSIISTRPPPNDPPASGDSSIAEFKLVAKEYLPKLYAKEWSSYPFADGKKNGRIYDAGAIVFFRTSGVDYAYACDARFFNSLNRQVKFTQLIDLGIKYPM